MSNDEINGTRTLHKIGRLIEGRPGFLHIGEHLVTFSTVNRAVDAANVYNVIKGFEEPPWKVYIGDREYNPIS